MYWRAWKSLAPVMDLNWSMVGEWRSVVFVLWPCGWVWKRRVTRVGGLVKLAGVGVKD